jgi:hypothetical protein
MYELEAILARKETIEGALDDFQQARIIRLPQDIIMIPMVGRLLQELEIKYQGGTKVTEPDIQQFSPSIHHDFERLIIGVDKFARYLSQHGMIAYVEATFTGGYGGHATMLWENGKVVGSRGDDINLVLRKLGVIATRDSDEFDTVGLGRHRTTKQWLQENSR